MRRALGCALVVSALGGACRSAGAPPPPSGSLAVAEAALDLGEPQSVELQLEPLFADGAGASSAADRFWSAWLLAQARALRALDVPLQGGVEERALRASRELGALYFAGVAAQEALAAGAGEPSPVRAGLEVVDAERGLELLRLAVLSRLGFGERVAWIADQLGDLEAPATVASLLELSGLHARLEPRVWYALFGDRSRRDPARAYPLAVRTLAASDRSPGSLGREEIRAVERWIEEEAPFLYRCPACGQAAVPQLRACPNDQTPLERFIGGRRP